MDTTPIQTTPVFLANQDVESAHQLPTVPHVLPCQPPTLMDHVHAPVKPISLSQLTELDIVLNVELTVLLVLMPTLASLVLLHTSKLLTTNAFVLLDISSMLLQTLVCLVPLDATNVLHQLFVKVALFLSFSKELPVNQVATMDSQLSVMFVKDVLQDV